MPPTVADQRRLLTGFPQAVGNFKSKSTLAGGRCAFPAGFSLCCLTAIRDAVLAVAPFRRMDSDGSRSAAITPGHQSQARKYEVAGLWVDVRRLPHRYRGVMSRNNLRAHRGVHFLSCMGFSTKQPASWAGSCSQGYRRIMDITPAELNLKQVAALLDVHYMTAYRYVRTGRLTARRVGTGWVVDRRDLDSFSTRNGTANSAHVPGPEPVTKTEGDKDRWRRRLRRTLVVGDETASWQILEQALAAGRPAHECYLEILVGAIDDISGRSLLPDSPIAEEYLAMATASRLVARLGARFKRPGRSRGTVVFGATLGEHHALAISVVADLVRLDGFTCLELGTDVPPLAFAGAAATASRLVAVGIGVTTESSLEQVGLTVRAVHELDPAIPVVLGGQAANERTGYMTGADGWASDGRSATAIFSELAKSRRKLWLVGDCDPIDSTGR